MTKQEEIREGIENIILTSPIARHQLIRYHQETTAKLLFYLRSQGVVIKVERELPDSSQGTYEATLGAKNGMDNMLKAGYVAVEPLIKEAI